MPRLADDSGRAVKGEFGGQAGRGRLREGRLRGKHTGSSWVTPDRESGQVWRRGERKKWGESVSRRRVGADRKLGGGNQGEGHSNSANGEGNPSSILAFATIGIR